MRIRTALTGAAGLAAVAVLSGAAPAMGAVAAPPAAPAAGSGGWRVAAALVLPARWHGRVRGGLPADGGARAGPGLGLRRVRPVPAPVRRVLEQQLLGEAAAADVAAGGQ